MILSRLTLASFFALCAVLSAETIPLINPPTEVRRGGQKLEIEQVEVYKAGAAPNTIKRSVGPFLLLVTNRTANDKVVFAVQAEKGDAPALVKIGGEKAWLGHSKLMALIDLPSPGVWLIKASETGETVCTISIE